MVLASEFQRSLLLEIVKRMPNKIKAGIFRTEMHFSSVFSVNVREFMIIP
jgi:hypothetical protein